MCAGRKGRGVVKLSIVLLAAAYLVTSMRCGDPIRTLPADFVLRDGDVLLLGSSTIRGRILKALDGGARWAHCGVAVAPNVIIHADPNGGVVSQTMEEYLADNDVDCVRLLRPSAGDGKKAAAFARKCVAGNVAFDNSFSYKKGSGMYCTELVLLAWEAAGVELLPDVGCGDRVKPSSLEESPMLCRVRDLSGPGSD